jgi:hypothetical protein
MLHNVVSRIAYLYKYDVYLVIGPEYGLCAHDRSLREVTGHE